MNSYQNKILEFKIVNIYFRHKLLGLAVLSDICSSGALLESETMLLFANDVIELRFISDSGQEDPYCQTAIVSGRTAVGVALQFDYESLSDVEKLTSLLQENTSLWCVRSRKQNIRSLEKLQRVSTG